HSSMTRKENPPVNLDPERLWTPEEVATFLGVPKATLYQWRYLGTGPKAGRVGRHLRYLPADVITWFRQQQDAA
ncbi:MAG: excisionase/Xis, DNA-binding protein, partial [Actinomycetia bacterium]|nr:excisionase/Xis, DNA-binding protein [Actinomycetes bacterium]